MPSMSGTYSPQSSSGKQKGSTGRGKPVPEAGASSLISSGVVKEKRTFKEKFNSLIQEAEEAEAKAQQQHKLQDRKSISVSLLVQGQPQAFIDFFKLTGEPESVHGSPSTSSGDLLSLESLLFLQQQLSAADLAGRQGNVHEQLTALLALGQFLIQHGQLYRAQSFYLRALEVCKRAEWAEGELVTNAALGEVYDALQDIDSAISCYERRLELATKSSQQDEVRAAYGCLVHVYAKSADSKEQRGDRDGALAFWQKCLDTAMLSDNLAATGEANYRLGLLHQLKSDFPQAQIYLKQYLDVSHQINDTEAEGRAYCALAQCHQQMGDPQQALQSLESYLELSQGRDPHREAVVCCDLGILHYQQRMFERAVTYFEKFFEVARTLGERRMVDVARVNLGLARGSLKMAGFFDVVEKDLPTLIQWKNNRTPIP